MKCFVLPHSVKNNVVCFFINCDGMFLMLQWVERMKKTNCFFFAAVLLIVGCSKTKVFIICVSERGWRKFIRYNVWYAYWNVSGCHPSSCPEEIFAQVM